MSGLENSESDQQVSEENETKTVDDSVIIPEENFETVSEDSNTTKERVLEETHTEEADVSTESISLTEDVDITEKEEGDDIKTLEESEDTEKIEEEGEDIENTEESEVTKDSEDTELTEEEEDPSSESPFTKTLKSLKQGIEENFNRIFEEEEPTTILHRYQMACIKYKVYPLKKCVENIDTETLDISNLNIGPQAFTPLIEALMFSTTITYLVIPGNRLGIQGLKYLSHLFSLNSAIKHLNFANNFIGPHGGDLITQILSNGYRLEFLDLSENGLEDRQLMEMVATLNDPPLQELNLKSNDFKIAGGVHLGKCLSTNTTLKVLDLSFNKFSTGASGLFMGLRNNKSLKNLDLTGNEINHDCSQDLGKLLEGNKDIEKLYLSFNKLNNESMNNISKGIKTNNILKILDLSFNPIQARGAQILISCVAGGDNKLEKLNLTGIRVNLAFLKTLSGIMSSGRTLEAKYGNRVSCELCTEHKAYLKEDGALAQAIKFADSHGLDLKVILKKIHAKFFVDLKAMAKKADIENKEEQKVKTSADLEAERYPRMEVEAFKHSLMTSALKLPDDLATTVAEAFANESGTVDIGMVIAEIPLRVHILEFEKVVADVAEEGKDKKKKDKPKKKK